jgi:4-amino-4-deoxy-L-arabinose transferase-like glycosyltransferase
MMIDLQREQEDDRVSCVLITGGVVIAALLLLTPLAMLRNLQNDEHQFVASGALLASHSALPYRDYPYFHMPNLVFIYALLFQLTDRLLLAARMFSVICGALAVGTVCWTALQLFPGHPRSRRILIALGAALLLMCNPLFTFTSGRAWNHDLSTLLALGAFLAYCRSARPGRSAIWMAGSGVLLGLAVGTRLSYLPLLAPFAGAVLWHPTTTSWRGRLHLAGALVSGVAVGLLPALFLLALTPEQFIFGNLELPRLGAKFREELEHSVAMTFVGKVKYLWDAIRHTGNLLVALALVIVTPWAAIMPPSLRAADLEGDRRFPLVFVLTLIPFLLIGSFAPTPTWYQYLYAPIPFVVLGVVYGLAAHRDPAALKIYLRVFVVVVAVATGYGFKDYRHTAGLIAFDQWVPAKIHRTGRAISAATSEGKILTLAPTLPLEGRREIYKELVTGPFVWRVGRFLPDGRRREHGVISERDLPDLFRRDPPRAVLVGFERHGVEAPLLAYAQSNGYTPLTLGDGTIIWLAPGDR